MSAFRQSAAPASARRYRAWSSTGPGCLVPQWQPPWQLPRTTVEDTVLDLVAGARTFDDAYGWISRAVGRRLTSPTSLSKALAGRSRIRWRAWITAALQDAADGVHSPLERNYVDGVERAHGLPTARRQAKRRHGSGARYLDDAADGAHSPLERNYVHGVERAHGLPTARRQAKRRHGSGARYLDNAYEDYPLTEQPAEFLQFSGHFP